MFPNIRISLHYLMCKLEEAQIYLNDFCGICICKTSIEISSGTGMIGICL